ncbi:ABC transporter ATP-binding protein [Fuchsiella alkaliacetigena]|uniref:ABC transporter ATP-binding protein n=1 Tax=Fuchsiella alkaliacetigena TaxID=957042 RepID=UPI00200A97BA|nr:ABC transporter ATP-binding protein [Fuchsiella alkaliacetigena]MCK8823647.1 ABC transporter ATP-binding protein/permease [Fuchsiella alkaliacetigena]
MLNPKKDDKENIPTDKSMLKVLIRLIGYAQDHCLALLGVVCGVLISTGLGLLPPWLIRYGIDNMIAVEEVDYLWLLALIMVAISILKGVIDFTKRYIAEYVSQSIIHDIRQKLYTHLNKLSFLFYDQSRTGDIMSRLTADADTLNRFLSSASVHISGNLLTIVGIFIIMFSWEFKLAILYLLMIPLMILAMKSYATGVRPMFRKARNKLAQLTSIAQEVFNGIEVVKLFGQKSWEVERFTEENRRYFDIKMKTAKLSAKWMPYARFVLGLGTTLVVWYGGRLIINQTVSVGVLVGFLGYISMLMKPIRQTGMMVNFSSQAVASAERIFEILDIEPDIKNEPGAYELPMISGGVEFKDVSFSYQNDSQILKGINLTVNPGETIAIVGATGAGKSTLVQLIPRFYDPDSGEVLIDGHNVKEVTIDSLRRQVGILLQNNFLFAASIRENISYGTPEASMEDIIESAKLAQIHDFITSLPLGYETPIGERGVNLSGGQKQRLTMARMLLTDPKLLILDEPTSSIDIETEEKMQLALKEVLKDRTTFIIAHRLWTVQRADRILVVKQGQIVEQGSHEELLTKDGVYSKLYDSVLKSGRIAEVGANHVKGI